ncbi:sensor histidine kinase [Actinocorallia populi]|uniref:sensor histidine kinase n=1 Tax=Actinocorallia populi TaxID=2079200 RepID=UPI0018E4FE46|nr:nitrate- and nitrite sensing domain-containing protein [Actinocorallia populi]
MSASQRAPVSRKRARQRSIRYRITLLLILPLASLLVLWAFAASLSLGEALKKIEFARMVDEVALPVGSVGVALQQERAAAAVVLGSNGRRGAQQLKTAEAVTDAALKAFREKALPSAWDMLEGETSRSLRELDQRYDGIAGLRTEVKAAGILPAEAIGRYDELFDDTTKALGGIAAAGDAGVYQTTIAMIDLNRAGDQLLREDALLSLLEIRKRPMTADEHRRFTRAATLREEAADAALTSPSIEVREVFEDVVRTPEYSRYQELEHGIVSSDRAATSRTLQEWRATIPKVTDPWQQAQLDAINILTDQTEAAGHSTLRQLLVVGGAGLLVVVASLLLSVRFARGLSGELRGLQGAAQELANERLPEVIARLRREDEVNVPAETPLFATGKVLEVARVADAFTKVQRTAIEAAVGEAQVRRGISRVFVNLAWRSQSLLQRQLRMLDAMERKASSPQELEELFHLDHLTTRMRRHAEGLVILSGSRTMRSWNRPVPVEDLLRAALEEVEDYTRVEVAAAVPVAVPGSVAADIIHLLAELIENATTFSPPHTEVQVQAVPAGNGLTVEVVDRGVGMDAEDLALVNQRLADAPEFDLAESKRLGLFVVARLAARHGIKVTLLPSVYGGTTAVVLIPASLVVSGEEPAARESGTRSPERGPAPAPADPMPRPASRAGDPVPKPSPGTPATRPGDEDGGVLPRRTRREHLAPQLRSTPMPAPGDDPFEAAREGSDENRPEANRRLLSSLQEGWTAARAADGDGPPAFGGGPTQGET